MKTIIFSLFFAFISSCAYLPSTQRVPSSEAPLPALSSQIYVSDDNSLMTSPQTYQVFQRSTLTAGNFTVKVRIALPNVDLIRVQVFEAKNNSNILLATELKNTQSQSSVYQKLLPLPAGGWYKIQIEQVSTAGQRAYRSTVFNFGIGDVFITSGQSNSTSAGEVLTSTKTGLVSAYRPQQNSSGHLIGEGSWQLNNDPQPPEGLPSESDARAAGYLRTNFGSVWPTMGDELSTAQQIPIATAETGVGGTSIAQWQKNYTGSAMPPYVRLMETTKMLLQTTGVRMILWDQGESDTGPEELAFPLDVYGNKFKKLQSDLATDVGQKIPWMMALASFGPINSHLDGTVCDSIPATEYWSAQGTPRFSIVPAQEKLIKDQFAFEGPHTDKYIGANYRYPGKRGTCIHFSLNAQIAVGKDWAEQILKTKFGEFPSGSTPVVPSQPPTTTGVLPTPSGLTPKVENLGQGCDDNLCLWFVVRDIESDFRIDMRKSDSAGEINWTYDQSHLFVSPLLNGSYAVTLRLAEPDAQQTLLANRMRYWVVNPTSQKWVEAIKN